MESMVDSVMDSLGNIFPEHQGYRFFIAGVLFFGISRIILGPISTLIHMIIGVVLYISFKRRQNKVKDAINDTQKLNNKIKRTMRRIQSPNLMHNNKSNIVNYNMGIDSGTGAPNDEQMLQQEFWYEDPKYKIPQSTTRSRKKRLYQGKRKGKGNLTWKTVDNEDNLGQDEDSNDSNNHRKGDY